MTPATTIPNHLSLEVLRWRNALLAVFVVSGFMITSLVSRLPTVRDGLDASTGEMGFLILGISSSSVATLFASGYIVARLGATRTIAVFSAVAALGVAAAGAGATLAPTLATVFLALVVLGVGNSGLNVAMNVSGAAAERALGRALMPLLHAAFSVGSLSGAGLGALAEHLGAPIGWHLAPVGLFAAVVVGALVRFLRPAELPAEVPPEVPTSEAIAGASAPKAPRALWREPRVLLIGLVVFGTAFAEGSANDWIALAMVDGHGLSNAGGAATLGVFLAAMLATRLAGARALDRFGRVPVLRVSAGLAATGLLLAIFGASVQVAVLGAAFWGAGAALGFPVGMSAAADDPARAAGTVSAVSAMGYCAFLAGPPVIGVLGQHTGLLRALLAVFALVVVAGLASGAVRRPASG